MSRLLLLLALSVFLPNAAAANLSTQRAEFKQAWKAAEQGDLAKLTPYLDELAKYPLYPYLRFAYLDNTLAQQPAAAIQAFLQEQADLPVAAQLRADWLRSLAERGDWSTVLANYRGENGTSLRCAVVSAHLALDQPVSKDWVVAAQHLWLEPVSQPATCNSALAWIEAHHQINNDMVRARFTDAMQGRRYDLARYLVRKLNAADRPWADIWLDMAADPAEVLENIQVPDQAEYQWIILDGLQLVARSDPARARHLWNLLAHRYQFASDAARAVQVQIALWSARDHLPDAAELLDRVKNWGGTLVTEWRIRTALRNGDWPTALKVLPQLGALGAKPEWRYWRARALAATGNTPAAASIYQSLADGMDYYGFLAADHLQQTYAISNEPAEPAPAVLAQIGARPGFVRARELYYADLYRYADNEWLAAAADLSRPARCQMALLAAQWGWHARAIRTLQNNGCWQDLDITYPLAFRPLLSTRAKDLQLSLAWIYGVIRAESLFSPRADSSAGAQGLMQLMPATGRHVAARLGVKLDGQDSLVQADNNLTLGSAYLSYMLQRFGGSETLATAAYNAGPNRVDAWLSDTGSLPMDVWVDTIPFLQTRTYIRRVLAGTVIFDWRLHGKTERLSTRMGSLPAASATRVAPAKAGVDHTRR
ncbi:MAG: transglycosylase SLT domain-containing protein [Gammaproteobacteria bacterium]